MTSTNEVTAADIARIAGVGRAAVSNWRRRHSDFPQPVGGPPNSPTFALADVEEWLNANRRLQAANTSAPSRRAATKSQAIDPRLAASLAALLPQLSGGTLLDPACMDGSLLVAAADRLGARVRYIGQDADPANVEMASAELADAGVGKFEVVVGAPFQDALARYVRSADAVISMLPPTPAVIPDDSSLAWEFAPPSRNDLPLAWVQSCFSYVKLGGTAVVVVPFATAARQSGRRIRAELLRAGVLTHVIGLPEQFMQAATGPWQIWILQRPTARPNYTLRMVDLMAYEPADVPADEKAWKAVFADTSVSRDIPSIELLDDEVLLVPAAHIEPEIRDVRPDYQQLGRAYADASGRLDSSVPSLGAHRKRPTFSTVTISELALSRALMIIERRDEVETGDVVVPLSGNGFDAITVADAPTTLQRHAIVVRCDPEQIDPYFLACFLRSETNRRQAAGTLSGTFRLDVRRARVPRVPLDEQRRYGDAFRRLMEFAGKAEQVATVAADAVSTAIYGLTSGVFAPEHSAPSTCVPSTDG